MSDPQTVREAIAEVYAYTDTDYCNDDDLAGDAAKALGVDPDMPLETFKRRQTLGERVLALAEGKQYAMHDLVWLTREDDKPRMMTGIWPSKAGEGTHPLDGTGEEA